MNRIASILLAFIVLISSGFYNELPVRVLILSGQNNHDWKTTTPFLTDAYLETGQFVVTVVRHPENILSVDLDEIDVIVFDWNTYGGKAGKKVTTWSDELKEKYVAFVSNGGGHVVVHAGSSSFPDWQDYQQICLASWMNGQTGHGKQHAFDVSATPLGEGHAILKDLNEFRIHDELWHRSMVSKNATPILHAFSATEHGGMGDWEPVVFIGEFGKGRCFTTLLGHQAKTEGQSMQTAQFGKLLIRGTLWAAGR